MRLEKARFLRGVRTLRPENVVRGQYRGYRETKGVDPASTVETYAALRLSVDSWRWADVPILVRAGKCMPVKATELVVELKRTPERLFPKQHPHGNRVRFQIDPDMAIAIEVQTRRPDTEEFEVEDVELLAMNEAGAPDPALPATADRRIGGRSRPVRQPGDDRGGVADRRPDTRRRDSRAPLRPRQLGAAGGRSARRHATAGTRPASAGRTINTPPTQQEMIDDRPDQGPARCGPEPLARQHHAHDARRRHAGRVRRRARHNRAHVEPLDLRQGARARWGLRRAGARAARARARATRRSSSRSR